MLVSTYSADSVRGYRSEGKEITLPVTFTSVAVISGNSDYSSPTPFQITDNGGLIYISACLTTSFTNIRLIHDQWTTNTIINTGELNNPFAINGTGNILYQVGSNVANTQLVLNSQSSYYGYTESANINVGANVGIRKISCDYSGNTVAIVTQAASSNNYYVNIYDYNGSNLTLQTNANLGVNAFGTANVYMNPSGNIVVMTHSEAPNIQVYTKSGNIWSFQSNVSSNTGSNNCVINNYGNILVYNTTNTNNNSTRIYTYANNIWSLSQTFYSNVSGNTQDRTDLTITNDGNIIASYVNWGPGGPNLFASTEIFQFDNANSNYQLTQTIGGSSPALTSEPGYLFIRGGLGAGIGNITVYSCL